MFVRLPSGPSAKFGGKRLDTADENFSNENLDLRECCTRSQYRRQNMGRNMSYFQNGDGQMPTPWTGIEDFLERLLLQSKYRTL